MSISITVIYPDGTISEETLDDIPKTGEKIGAFVVARVETNRPRDKTDTCARVFLQKAEE